MCWNVLEEFNLVDVVFPAKYTIRLPHVDMYISTEKNRRTMKIKKPILISLIAFKVRATALQ